MNQGGPRLGHHLNIRLINPNPVGQGGAGAEATQIVKMLHSADAIALLGQTMLGSGFQEVGVVAEMMASAQLATPGQQLIGAAMKPRWPQANVNAVVRIVELGNHGLHEGQQSP
jgi:hypothetical protein